MHLDGHSLDLDALERGRPGRRASIDPAALERGRAVAPARRGGQLAPQPVYGRTTGVGAARDESTDSEVDHGLRLLRSHAAGWGEVCRPRSSAPRWPCAPTSCWPAARARTPRWPQALADLVGAPDGGPAGRPPLRLARAPATSRRSPRSGLALIGERERAGGERRADLQLTSADALPLMSSNAFAIAETGLHAASLHALARAADTVCALSFVALQGNPEAVSETAAAATPFRGAQEVARVLRELLADQPGEPAHLQDFFGLRTWPQVHGPVLDTVLDLKAVVETAANTASENPLFTGDRTASRR